MKRVCILLAPGYEEIEALTPVDYLRRAGLNVDVVSTTSDVAVTGAHDIIVQADTFLEDLSPKDYDLVVIPGGLPGAENLARNDQVIDFVTQIYEQGAYVAAICAGPMVLEKAGLLQGKKATCYPGFENEIGSAATLSDLVVIDGRIITSRGPAAANYFALALVGVLLGKEKAEELKEEVILNLVEKM